MHIKAVLALLLLFSIYGAAFAQANWYNPAWQYRRAITLGEARNITRINEPVYVTIAGTDGRIGNCTKELRITDANNAEIPSQVDSDSVAGGTYSCTAAFMANSSALGSGTYYAYYGNPSAAAPNYPPLDSFFSVTPSLLKNSYYNLPIDSYGFIYPSFSSAGSGSYDITMATGRPYCDNQRWMFSLIQNGTGYSIGSGGGCTNPAASWSVGKNGSVFKEVQANFATNPSATYYWRTRLFPKSRYIEVSLDARLSAAVNLTDASMSMVPGSHSTAWDQYSSVSSTSLAINTNSSWGTYGSGSVIYGNVRNVTVSRSYAGWEGGVGLHHAAYLLAMPSNVLTCASYPCTYTYSFRLAWTTDYSVAANRITGNMLDNPLSVSVGAPQSFFISAGISPAAKTTYPNTNETFSLWLNNNQSVADNFTLSCTGTCYYSENPVVTSAGQNKSVSVTITSAGVSGTTAYLITATSAANASNFAAASASLTVDATTWRSQWTDAFNNPYAYRTPITVTNNGSALTDYQVPINISNLVYNNSGLVASWHFNEGAGTRFVDSSGNGNDGTYAGEALNNGTLTNFNFTAGSGWADGKYGKALRFDGVNDYVNMGDVDAVEGMQKATYMAWVNPSLLNTYYPIVTKYDSYVAGGGGAGGFSLVLTADNRVQFFISDTSDNRLVAYTSSAPAQAGQWQQVAAVFDGSQANYLDKIRIYLNGAEQSLTFINTYGFTLILNTPRPLRVGAVRFSDGSWGIANGSIDDVRIYTRALSAGEIAQVYQNNTFLRNGLAGYWRLDENAGTTAQDTHHVATPDNKDGTKSGNALSFDGVNDYAAAVNSASLNAGKFTVAAWIKTGSSADSFIVDKWGSDTGYAFWILGSKITLTVNYYLNRVSGNSTVTDGAWHYAVATHDGQAMRIYVDGNLDGTLALAQDAISTAFDLNIGRYRQSNANYFNGTIDEVRIYNRTLSAQEIAAMYAAGKLKLDYADLRFANSSVSSIPYWLESDNRAWVKVPYIPNGESTIYTYYGNPGAVSAASFDGTFAKDFGETGLAGAWHMDEGSGTTTADSSGGGSTGTLTNGPAWQPVDGGQWDGRSDAKFSAGSSLRFDGVDDYAKTANRLPGVYDTFTVELWLYPTKATLGDAINPMHGGYSFGAGHAGAGIEVSTGQVRVTEHSDGYYSERLSHPVSLGGWNHIAVVYVNKQPKLYINGNWIKDGLTSSYVVHPSTGQDGYPAYASTGWGKGVGSGAYGGYMDEVRIYGRALSQGEIRAHYERRKYAATEPTYLFLQEENPNPFALLGISPASRTAYPNYNETFSLWVYNNQTVSDTFTLSCAGTCSVSPSSLPLTAGQNGSATVTVTSANVSGTTAYAITATSQSNASNYASIFASITVDATRWRDQWTDAYGNGFRYAVPITLNNTGSALTDYQVNVTVDVASRIVLGRMRVDCGDLRFTNGTNELPHWVESGCNTSSMRIWVRVPYVPAGNSTVYVYYGNPAAAPKSSGNAVFDYFDQGNQTSLWAVAGNAGQDVSLGNPAPSYRTAGTSGSYFKQDIGLAPNRIIEYDEYTTVLGHFDFLSDTNGAGQGFDLDTRNLGPGDHSNWYRTTGWTAWTLPADTGFVAAPGSWYRMRLVIGGSSAAAYYSTNGGASYNALSPPYAFTSSGGFIGLNGDGGGGQTNWDNIRVRKYASPEPVALSGAEQSKGYRTLVRRCGAKQAGANVTAYQAGNATGSCVSDSNGICALEISAGMYDLQLRFTDNSTAWKNGTAFN